MRRCFQTWDNCDNIIQACYTLVNLLKQVYEHEHAAIEAEYLYLFYTLVRQLDSAFDCREQRLSVRSFRRFLYEQMRRTRLPFAGEPLAQVQIMGLLETRALDFDHVIILSCNENTLPAPKRQNSLFPYDVLTEFKLPTYARRRSHGRLQLLAPAAARRPRGFGARAARRRGREKRRAEPVFCGSWSLTWRRRTRRWWWRIGWWRR